MTHLRFQLIALLAWLAPSLVSAETALVVPPSGDAALKKEQAEAQQVLIRALESQAVRVLRPEDANASLGGAAKECSNIDCVQPLLRASGADVAAAVAVWGAGGSSNQPNLVYVTLVDRRGDRYPAKTRVERGDLAATIKQALLEARALQLLGPGPWLRVRAEPSGAQVLVDDKTAGTAPLRMQIQPGRHRLELRLDGYRPHAQTVDVPPTDARQIEVEVKLTARDELAAPAPGEPAEAKAAVDRETETGRLPHRGPAIVGPIVLASAGGALIVYDIAAHLVAIGQGSCLRRESDGACTKKNETNIAPTVVYAAAGAAAVGGAILWYVLTDKDDSADRLQVSAGVGALSVSGSF